VAGFDTVKNEVSFFIKVNHKSHTWTSQLAALASKDKQQAALAISLDGPFGVFSITPSQYSTVLFIAGGIGITPFLTAMQSLMLTPSEVSRIKLVWVIRDLGLLDIFASRLTAISTSNPVLDFQFTLYVSAPNFDENDKLVENLPGNMKVVKGRPDVSEVAMVVLGGSNKEEYKNSKSVCLLVCGPRQLAGNAVSVATSLGIDYHREVFEY